MERSVQQCRNGKPSLFLKWKLAPGRKRELGVWRVLYLRGTRKGGRRGEHLQEEGVGRVARVVPVEGGTQRSLGRHSKVIREALRGH